MDIIQKRYLVFFLLCIPARLGIAYLSTKLTGDKLKYLGYTFIIFAIGITMIYLRGSKLADSQLKWAGKDKIWWNEYRPLHGLLYLAFGMSAINMSPDAWKPMVADAILGSILFLQNQQTEQLANKISIQS